MHRIEKIWFDVIYQYDVKCCCFMIHDAVMQHLFFQLNCTSGSRISSLKTNLWQDDNMTLHVFASSFACSSCPSCLFVHSFLHSFILYQVLQMFCSFFMPVDFNKLSLHIFTESLSKDEISVVLTACVLRVIFFCDLLKGRWPLATIWRCREVFV